MGFEKFTGKRRPVKDQAMISILKTGQLGLNQTCYKEYFKDYKYVILYYDRKRKVIGIQPTNEPTNEAYNVRLGRGGNLANISAIAFLKYFKISHEATKAYPATWNDKEKLVEITL